MYPLHDIKIKCSKSLSTIPILLTVEFTKSEGTIDIEWAPATTLEIRSSTGEPVFFSSVFSICRFLARVSSNKLYGSTVLQRTEVDNWLEFSNRKYTISEFKEIVDKLNAALSNVTYLVGDIISLADICLWGTLFSSKQFQNMLKDGNIPLNLRRWYLYLSKLDEFKTIENTFPEEFEMFLSENTDNNPSNKKMKTEDKGKFVDLPGAEMGKVIVRFPPEASGFLHIGHAKAALLNAHYQTSFEGKLVMRFDDTNPEKEKEDFEKVILEDVSLLQIKPDVFTYTSNHFDLILQKCEDLLKSGKAYVDDTDPEVMKSEREQRTESRNRNNLVEKNWSMWEEMKNGSEYGKRCCVRAKIDMNSDNGCLRDPTIYRCKAMSHPRTGDKYKVYPTYDFACPIVDSIEDITHALRTTEYHDRDDQYFWVLDVLNLRKPYIYEYSRLNMTNTVLSKRKLTWFVDQGIVDGWDDPRMPTVRGVLRRGMTVEGLKQFIVAQGSSRSVVVMEWDKIWAFNKKIIDPLSARYNAVEVETAIPVVIEDAEEKILEVAKHPKNSDLGTKDIHVGPNVLVDYIDAEAMKVGDNVTFINWGNLIITNIKHDASGKIQKVSAKTNLDNKDYKKTLKVTWVINSEKTPLVPCNCVYFDHLISKAVLGKDDDFKSFMNDNTKISVMMKGDSDLSTLKKGDIIQIQRKGFFICDEPYDPSTLKYTSRECPVVLFSIPDGTKDNSTLPTIVKSAKMKKETLKEQQSSSKGKLAEKSPQEENKNNSISLSNQIEEQGNIIRKFKAEKVSKDVLTPEVNKLLELKAEYKNLTNSEWKPSNEKVKKESSEPKNIDVNSLDQEIQIQGESIRKMKAEKVSKEVLTPEVNKLLQLKAEYKKLTSSEWKPSKEKVKNESSEPKENIDVSSLDQEIQLQGENIRNMKANKVSKDLLQPEITKLLNLKTQYKEKTGTVWQPSSIASTISKPTDNKTDVAAVSSTESQGNSNLADNSVSMLDNQIREQGDKIRNLKAQKVNKDQLNPEINKLLSLKAEYKKITNIEWQPSASLANEKKAPSNEKEKANSLKGKMDEKSPQDEENKVADLLNIQIKEQGDIVRHLKSEKASKEAITPEINKLLILKAEYKEVTKKEWQPAINSDKKTGNKTDNKKQDCGKQQGKKPNPKESEVNTEPIAEPNAAQDSGLKKVTRLGMEVKKEENLADWYSQVLTKSEMIEYYDVSGCYILRPWAFGIWEVIQNFFDAGIKELGVTNCYFPMFVSSQALEKEKTHIADFAPEVAWVTKSGGTELEKPIAIRPTSETVMYPSYAKWIRSHRDLPLRLNQWCSVVRWEFRNPQPFIRTREFLWQEGHTAFATREEAVDEVHTILNLYAQVYEDLLAIPVIKGRKTEKEKFAGADFTTTVEAYVSANGRGIQGATSHHLGQNFSKMFEIVFEDPETFEKKFAYQNSWGLSTRSIGAMVMIHADNTGLVLPPRVAAHQVIIVPCGITVSLSDDVKKNLLQKCNEFELILRKAGIKVKGDYRDNYSPGWKFNYWELKGVPVRVEIGPKDLQKSQFVAVRRDTGEKIMMGIDSAPSSVSNLLNTIHDSMYAKAKRCLNEHLCVSYDWDDFCNKLEKRCIIQSPFCGEISCEEMIKKNSAKNADELVDPGAPSMGAKSLCIPFEQPDTLKPENKCINNECKNKPQSFALFGRSY